MSDLDERWEAPLALPDAGPNAYARFGVAATVTAAVAPVPFAGAGGRHLAWELVVANHSGAEMLLERLEVMDDTATLAAWEGAELREIVAQRRPGVADSRAIPAGGWAVVYVWATLEATAAVPRQLRYRLTVGDRGVEGTVPVDDRSPIVVGPPLRGGVWVAATGPGNASVHRRALVPIGGQTFIAQRYAADWAQLGPGGQPFEGDPLDNASYVGYGADVIAVADGVVASVKDGIPDNVPGGPRLRAAGEADTLRAVPMTLETVAGNHVILDVGDGRYAFYGHLMPGSPRVHPGERVRRGDVIARLGNSGNSTGPHLHFHIADRAHPLAAEGLPFVIDAWELRLAPGRWERRRDEAPMRNARVRFASG